MVSSLLFTGWDLELATLILCAYVKRDHLSHLVLPVLRVAASIR